MGWEDARPPFKIAMPYFYVVLHKSFKIQCFKIETLSIAHIQIFFHNDTNLFLNILDILSSEIGKNLWRNDFEDNEVDQEYETAINNEGKRN